MVEVLCLSLEPVLSAPACLFSRFVSYIRCKCYQSYKSRISNCGQLVISFLLSLQSSNESMADEESEDAISQTDSKTDSRTDLQDAQDMTVLGGPMNTSKHSVSSETEVEPLRASFSSTPPSTPKSPGQKVHKFLYKTFSLPYKCNYCTSLLIGVHRQGITCDGKRFCKKFFS